MTDRDPQVNPSTEDELDAEDSVTSEDITDTEFGEDPDIEVPDTDE